MAQELGIKRNVSFYNRFVELEELKIFLGVTISTSRHTKTPRRPPRARWLTPSAAARR